ncbi:MAG: hypothetical protein ACM3O7_06580 [Acidobacteriota bacterium]
MPLPPVRRGTAGHDLLLGRLLSRVWVLFLLGLAIGVVMVVRSQVGGDQLDMLARGWLFARGEWLQYGMTTSANGKSPGGMIALLAGLPLLVWRDYRSPALFILLAHALAFGLLDRTVRRIVTPPERLLFALLYWLGPWQLTFAGFVWNPNWIAVLSAVHLWSAYVQRTRAGFWASFVHVLALGVFVQIHASVVILIVASVALLLLRCVRVHWGGVAAAGLISAAMLVPWVMVVAAEPALLPGGKGFLFRGLVLVYPMLRGAFYWTRLASLQLDARMTSYDFTALVGDANRWLAPSLHAVALAIGVASLVVPLLAGVWLVRRGWRWRRTLRSPVGARAWLTRYVVVVLVGAVTSFAVSPTTIMTWQCFPVLPSAVLAVVLWAGVMLRAGHARVVRRLAPWWLAAELALLVAAGTGAPMFRRGGADSEGLRLQRDHPMFRELGLLDRTGISIDPASDWMPDVLRHNPAQGR